MTHLHTLLCILSIGGFQVKLSTQVAYVPGSFRDSQTPQFAGARRPGSGEVLPVSGDATSRRVHELGRWLTPVPSTEVKDQIRRVRIVEDLARPPPKTPLFYHTRRAADNGQADITSTFRLVTAFPFPCSLCQSMNIVSIPRRKFSPNCVDFLKRIVVPSNGLHKPNSSFLSRKSPGVMMIGHR